MKGEEEEDVEEVDDDDDDDISVGVMPMLLMCPSCVRVETFDLLLSPAAP